MKVEADSPVLNANVAQSVQQAVSPGSMTISATPEQPTAAGSAGSAFLTEAQHKEHMAVHLRKIQEEWPSNMPAGC